jgi:hypothetical protein
MSVPEPLAGGELDAAITREVAVSTLRLGGGPEKSSSFHNGCVVMTLMQGA